MNNLGLLETKYHEIVLYEKGQLYIGRSVVVLKNKRKSLSEMSVEEWIDFEHVVKKYENALRECFGATYFNWGCFLNDAYKSEPFQPSVHWQVRPRYQNPVNFNGKQFVDTAFGSQFLRKDNELILAPDFLEKIADELKKYFV